MAWAPHRMVREHRFHDDHRSAVGSRRMRVGNRGWRGRTVGGHRRHGHSWHSNADAGLYVSIVLRLPMGANALPVVMLALGLAAQEAIAKTSGIAADLRWPNDVMIGGKKCAGILAQLEDGAIVAGIGINVNHEEFPEEIAPLATSLRLAGAYVEREDLLVALLRAIDDACEMLIAQGTPAILEAFTRASSYASRTARALRARWSDDRRSHARARRIRISAGARRQRKGHDDFTGGVRPA